MRWFRAPILVCASALAATTLAAVAQDGQAAAAAASAGTVAPDAAGQAMAAPEPWLDSGGYWRLMASPYTVHFSPSPEHEWVYMVGLERQRSDGWVWGGTYFSNSFGQPSGYVYVGEKIIGFTRWQPLFAQWTAGVLYGYKYPYENKVPFNHNGFSPGATISLGWQFTREFSMQAIALGNAGMMFQLAYDLR